MASKDDSALWLHNKLGSALELWNHNCYTTVVSHYNIDRLMSIKECFHNLDSAVKMKFFLSLLYTKKSHDEYKDIIKEIIENTLETCTDQWVNSMAIFIKAYLDSQFLDSEKIKLLESFNDVYNDLNKSLEKEDIIPLLPLECDYLTKVAKSSYPELPQLTKHFNLIRLAKSAELMQEIKLKATNYLKNKKPNEKLNIYRASKQNQFDINTTSVHAQVTQKVNLQTPGFLKRTDFNASTITGKTSLVKRDTGIKLLDLQDQPIINKDSKRKKKEPEKEKEDLKKFKLDNPTNPTNPTV